MSRAGVTWPRGPAALPLTYRLDGAELHLLGADPVRLLHLLATGDWPAILPGLLDDDGRYAIAVRLYDPDDHLDLDHVWRAACIVGGAIAGTTPANPDADAAAGWWPATRLASLAVHNWMLFDGWAGRRGFDPWAAPLHRTIALAWQFAVEHRPVEGEGKNAKQQPVDVLRRRIFDPPAQHRKQVMKFSAATEREVALAALRDILPGESPAAPAA